MAERDDRRKKEVEHRCSDCDPPKYFKQENNFRRHVREYHTELRKYECGECKKTYRRKDQLRKHAQKHETEKRGKEEKHRSRHSHHHHHRSPKSSRAHHKKEGREDTPSKRRKEDPKMKDASRRTQSATEPSSSSTDHHHATAREATPPPRSPAPHHATPKPNPPETNQPTAEPTPAIANPQLDEARHDIAKTASLPTCEAKPQTSALEAQAAPLPSPVKTEVTAMSVDTSAATPPAPTKTQASQDSKQLENVSSGCSQRPSSAQDNVSVSEAKSSEDKGKPPAKKPRVDEDLSDGSWQDSPKVRVSPVSVHETQNERKQQDQTFEEVMTKVEEAFQPIPAEKSDSSSSDESSSSSGSESGSESEEEETIERRGNYIRVANVNEGILSHQSVVAWLEEQGAHQILKETWTIKLMDIRGDTVGSVTHERTYDKVPQQLFPSPEKKS